MPPERLDLRGLECPVPLIRTAAAAAKASPGDEIIVLADCPRFEEDLRSWAERLGHEILSLESGGGGEVLCRIRITAS